MKAIFLLTGMVISVQCYSQFKIEGQIRDNDGIPLAGASILLENTYLGTISGPEGCFEIRKVPGGRKTLSVSYVGYESKKLNFDLNADTVLNIELIRKTVLGEEVIVTSTRAGTNVPGAVSEISREELTKHNLGQDIPWLLSSSPSMVVSSDAGTGIGYTGFRIRGTDANRINVSINGIPLNDAESHGVFFVDLPDFAGSTENIQIQRGVGTSQNGAAAFGASINFQTLTLNPEPYSEISGSFGSFNTYRNSIRLGTGLLHDHFTVDARVSGIHSDGYIDRAFSDLKSYFISTGYHSSKNIIKLNIFSGNEKTYQAWDGVPGYLLGTDRTYNGLGRYTDENGIDRYYENQTDNYKQDHYQVHISREINNRVNMNVAFHLTHGEGYYEEYSEDQMLSLYKIQDLHLDSVIITQSDLIRRKWLDNDFYGLVYSLNYRKQKIEASFGGGWNQYTGRHFGKVIWARFAGNSEIDHTWYRANSDKKDLNLYAKLNYTIGRNLNFYGDFQTRSINYGMKGEDDDLRNITQEHSYLFFNPKAGLNYDNDRGHRAYFMFSVANREPNRSNFVDTEPGQPVPLKETLYDYELGYSYSGNLFTSSLGIYYMDYTNQLVLTGEINDVGAAIMSNVKDSYRVGTEISAGIKLPDLLEWGLSLNFSRNKILDFTSYVDNWSYWDNPPAGPRQYTEYLGTTDISFSPEMVASSNLKYLAFKNMSIDFISKYVGEQFIDNSSSDDRKLEPWFINDLRWEYRIHPAHLKEFSLNLTIANIFNTHYSSNAWVYRYVAGGKEEHLDGYFPQAGINFLSGLRVSF